MATNRKQPFGYRMEWGRIVLHPQEASWVQEIFRRYLAGASFRELTDTLREQGIPYDGDKPWNKNMVARILSDSRYAGNNSFPPLVTLEQITAVREQRQRQSTPIRQTELQKAIRQLSGKPPTSDVEEQVLALLEQVGRKPSLLELPVPEVKSDGQIQKMEQELEDLLSTQPVDENRCRQCIRKLAAARYSSFPDSDYETLRIQRLFSQSRGEITAELIKNILTAIQTDSRGQTRLVFKNRKVL